MSTCPHSTRNEPVCRALTCVRRWSHRLPLDPGRSPCDGEGRFIIITSQLEYASADLDHAWRMIGDGEIDGSLPAYRCDVCGLDWPDDEPPDSFERSR